MQRAEGALIAVTTIVTMTATGTPWWWPLVLFLAFDASMLGYLRSTEVGAVVYNAVHNYAAPAAVLVLAVLSGHHAVDGWPVVLAGSWLFHVGLDRAMGFGLRPLHAPAVGADHVCQHHEVNDQ